MLPTICTSTYYISFSWFNTSYKFSYICIFFVYNTIQKIRYNMYCFCNKYNHSVDFIDTCVDSSRKYASSVRLPESNFNSQPLKICYLYLF